MNKICWLGAVALLGIACFVELASAEYNCEYKKDGFYADEDFCHIYWRCNYGVAEEHECSAGTAWNHVEMRCDWLDNVDCTRVKDKPEKKSGEEDDENEDKEKEDTTKKAKKSTRTSDAEETSTTSETLEENQDTKIGKFLACLFP
jgi:hypothetical protein